MSKIIQSNVVLVCADVSQPLPKSCTNKIDKLEDYLTRSPHRAAKVCRRLHRQCSLGINAIIRNRMHATAGEDFANIKNDEGDGIAEYDADFGRVRISLETFDSLLKVDALRADDVIIGTELLPLLISLLSLKPLRKSGNYDKNIQTLCCLGCYYMFRFISSLEDFIFVEHIEKIIVLVNEVVLREMSQNCNTEGKPGCGTYSICVLHQIIWFCQRTGHIVIKMPLIVETLLMWLENVSADSSKESDSVHDPNEANLIPSPLPVSTVVSDDDNPDTSINVDSRDEQKDCERDSSKREAISALKTLSFLSSDLETMNYTILPILEWLNRKSRSNKSKWHEPAGRIAVSTMLHSYIERNEGYSLLCFVVCAISQQLKKKLNVVTLESHRAESEDFYLSEIEFVKAIIQAIDKELAIPSLFLLYKELIPIINIDFIDEKDSEVKVKEDLNLELLSLFVTCGMKVNECKQLFHVIAGVLGQAVASVKMEAVSSNTNNLITRTAKCLAYTATSIAEYIVIDNKEDILLSSDIPIALSNEICRAFLRSASILKTTLQQQQQQIAVLQLLVACLALTSRIIPFEKQRNLTSTISSMLSPSKFSTSQQIQSEDHGRKFSKEQLLSLLSAIFHRLQSSSNSPLFIVMVDTCYNNLLATNHPDVVLSVALPMALAVQQMALCGWTVNDSPNELHQKSLRRLRLLMLSFSMLRHIGRFYDCLELPKEAHPRSVKGLIDDVNGIRLDKTTGAYSKSSKSADESMNETFEEEDEDEDSIRILSLFVREFDNKGGVLSAKDSVVNSLLSKHTLSSSLSKATKEKLAQNFVPFDESWLLHEPTMAKVMKKESNLIGKEKLPTVQQILHDVLHTSSNSSSRVELNEDHDEPHSVAIQRMNEALAEINVSAEIKISSEILDKNLSPLATTS